MLWNGKFLSEILFQQNHSLCKWNVTFGSPPFKLRWWKSLLKNLSTGTALRWHLIISPSLFLPKVKTIISVEIQVIVIKFLFHYILWLFPLKLRKSYFTSCFSSCPYSLITVKVWKLFSQLIFFGTYDIWCIREN